MYEVDFTGWTRTPEELDKLRTDWKYRWKMNWRRVGKAMIQRRHWCLPELFWDALCNKNYF